MAAFFQRIRNLLVPPVEVPLNVESSTAEPTATALTNQTLSDFMSAQFQDFMRAQSTDLTLLFPTCFVVYLDADDYADCAPALPFITKELCRRFTDIVHRELDHYPDYTQHASTWHFKYIPVHDRDEVPPEVRTVAPTPGHPSATMMLCAPPTNSNTEHVQGRVVGTLRNVGTLKAMNTGIDLRALGKLYKDNDGSFAHPIELNLTGTATVGVPPVIMTTPKQSVATPSVPTPTGPTPPEPTPSAAAASVTTPSAAAASVATASRRGAIDDAGCCNPATMLTIKAQLGKLIDSQGRTCASIIVAPDCRTVEIHGRDTAVKAGPDSAIIRVDSQEVLNPHITLQRMPDNRWSYIVHGDTLVNEVPAAPDSRSALPLPNHSTLLLPGPAQLYLTF